MKRLLTLLLAFVFVLTSLFVLASPSAKAYSNSRIIDDSVFDNVGSMTEAQIRAFINSRPGTCLVNLGTAFPEPKDYFNYGPNLVDAARVIYVAAQTWSLNPQVILTTLQKEQSLLTDNDCYDPQGYSSVDKAMGYYCLEGGAECPPPAYKYFERQVMKGSWQLKFNKERAVGNLNWNGDQNIHYTDLNIYTAGNRQDYAGAPTIYHDGYYYIDGVLTNIETGATASLYRYTPHWPQSFPTIFQSWFGSTTGPCLANGDAAGGPGPRIMSYNYAGRDRLAYTQLNKTNSGCVEVHVWNPTFNGWVTNVATGARTIDPSSGILIASRSNVDHQSSINYVTVGNVEVHRFSPSLTKMPGYYDVGSNLNGNTTVGSFVAGNFFGNGNDYLAYILHAGTNGGMEIHLFDQSMTKAIGFYDLPTDIGAVTNGTFVAGDFLGRGYAQLAYISYGNTEVHLFDIRNGRAARIYEVPTNLTNTSASTGTFAAGDFLGIGHAQLVYVIYNNGSRVETHMFDNSLTKVTGTQDVITNMGGFSP